jgi:hypothetical protein
MLGSTQSQSGHFTKEKNLLSLPGIRTPTPRPGGLVTISHMLTRLLLKSCVVIIMSNSDLFVDGLAAIEGPFYFHPSLTLNHCVVGYCIVWQNNWLPTFRRKEWIRSRRMPKHELSIQISEWTLIWETPVVNPGIIYLLLIWLKGISGHANAECDFSLSSSFRLSGCDIKMPWI